MKIKSLLVILCLAIGFLFAAPVEVRAERSLQQIFNDYFGVGVIDTTHEFGNTTFPAGRYEVTLIAKETGAPFAPNGWYSLTNPNELHEIFSANTMPQAVTEVDIGGEFGLWISTFGLWRSQPEFNADGRDHFSVFAIPDGGYAIGIEDLPGGGDNDFQDHVLAFAIREKKPTPFLDLPWDYEGKGKSFEQAAFDPRSWFDHKYPLQNIPCCVKQVMKYTGETKSEFYRSHNGYDYGSDNGVFLNTPVLAGADGRAEFVPEAKSGGAGNVIKVDHGNGYQTWYEHLQRGDLIVSSEDQRVFVRRGEQIGKVGMSGNTTGPHIHFSVFKDRDNDGSFGDEFPYGAADPLGWEGKDADPWPKDKDGAASFNLFLARREPQTVSVPQDGGTVNFGDLEVTVPPDVVEALVKLSHKDGPFEFISESVVSIVPSFFLEFFEDLGNRINEFSKPVKITYDYSGSDLANINEDSLQFFSFNAQTNTWGVIPTIIDKVNKIATGEVFHFSQFALMGEVLDLIAPETKARISGERGQDNWYRSNVTVELNGEDNHDGIGLKYTLYSINGSDWAEYINPLTFSQEGDYTITYQSFDKAENAEERRSISFTIDKTPPEAKFAFNTITLQTEVIGMDNNSDTQLSTESTDSRKKTTIIDKAGNTTTINYTQSDNSGNNTKSTAISVKSLTYNNNPQIQYQSNGFSTSWSMDYPDISKIKSLGQNFIHTNNVYLTSGWQLSVNQTSITINYLDQSQPQYKETKDGLVLLSIATNNGKLEYRW